MKRILYLFGVALAFSACNQCQDCNFESESAITEVCRDDYDSNADYQTALSNLEEEGADWITFTSPSTVLSFDARFGLKEIEPSLSKKEKIYHYFQYPLSQFLHF